MEFAAARQQFEALAEARGWAIAREGPAVAIRSEDDCLRLRPTSSGVVFEITHGPTAGPPAGWLDLHSDPTRPGQPPLADCIEYGLDLMEPGRGVSTATVPAVPTPSDPKPSAGVCHFGVLFQNRAFYLWPAFRRKVTKP